ncbi:MAG: hypothetical protein KUG78_15275 [Kangiellaceae bacterium]|nr:hypothetical protein [Kangiellaceae bacterium]
MRDWYQAASNYGESHSIVIFQLTDRAKNNWGTVQSIKIGEIELGSSGRGFDDIGKYILNRPTKRFIYELMILTKGCEHIQNGSRCVEKTYSLNLKDGTLSRNEHLKNRIEPSFNCNASLSYIEKTICDSLVLSNLDLIMSKLYKISTSVTKKSEQRKWLRKRNKCELDAPIRSCLVQSYNAHIDAFLESR